MAKKIDYSDTKEIFPMDLGNFKLYDMSGYLMPKNHIQKIFNAPMWKSYYLGNLTDQNGFKRFIVSSIMDGSVMELKIKQF